MATESVTRASRPRPWLLVLFGVVLVTFLWSKMFSGSSTPPAVSTATPRPAGSAPAAGRIDPAELDVKIESLQQTPPPPADSGRNPFRFQPKAPPPSAGPPKPTFTAPPVPTEPPVPQGPPPIGNLIKFIGIVETGRERIGAFSDCRYTFSGRDGEVVEGRFRIVRIGVESAVVEYADGRGRTTLPLNGQACVGK
jgi:hypothetical protein